MGTRRSTSPCCCRRCNALPWQHWQAHLHTVLQGKKVVRLKGGCPSTFSRVSGEVAALAAASVPFQLVPGVSSALAAPLLAGRPLANQKKMGVVTIDGLEAALCDS